MHRQTPALAATALAWLASFGVTADYELIAGYTPGSDVVEHSELDLDMADIDANADLQTDAGFLAAWDAYANGGNSEKVDSIRTIRGFSTSAQEKLSGEPLFEIYEDYWGSPDYADQFTAAACNGTGDFADVDPVVRAEGCTKGAQYQNVWMYVIHELEDAIGDCEIGDLSANDGGPHAWDEGWAFYAGSLEGTDGSGDGFMIHALADKRCPQFATCTGDDDGSDITGTSEVNAELLELYAQGKSLLLAGDCEDVEGIKDKIVDLMTVPLLQGLLRYFYLADPDAYSGGAKEAAELWAFSASVLPRIHSCDPDVADVIRANTDITSTDAPMSDGYVALKEKLESTYSCMGVSCSQIGGLVVESTTTYIDGFEPCSDSDGSNNAEAWGIGIGIVAAVAVVGIAACFFIRRRRNKKTSQKALDSDLGGFGGTQTSNL